jgi:hypothetical protein
VSRAAIHALISYHQTALFFLDCFAHRCAGTRNDAGEKITALARTQEKIHRKSAMTRENNHAASCRDQCRAQQRLFNPVTTLLNPRHCERLQAARQSMLADL